MLSGRKIYRTVEWNAERPLGWRAYLLQGHYKREGRQVSQAQVIKVCTRQLPAQCSALTVQRFSFRWLIDVSIFNLLFSQKRVIVAAEWPFSVYCQLVFRVRASKRLDWWSELYRPPQFNAVNLYDFCWMPRWHQWKVSKLKEKPEVSWWTRCEDCCRCSCDFLLYNVSFWQDFVQSFKAPTPVEGLAAAAVAFQLLIEGTNDATNLVEFLIINQVKRYCSILTFVWHSLWRKLRPGTVASRGWRPNWVWRTWPVLPMLIIAFLHGF